MLHEKDKTSPYGNTVHEESQKSAESSIIN